MAAPCHFLAALIAALFVLGTESKVVNAKTVFVIYAVLPVRKHKKFWNLTLASDQCLNSFIGTNICSDSVKCFSVWIENFRYMHVGNPWLGYFLWWDMSLGHYITWKTSFYAMLEVSLPSSIRIVCHL